MLGAPNKSLSTRDALRWGSRGSLVLYIAGPQRGYFHDFEDGGNGDAVGLVRHAHGCTMPEALRKTRRWLGDPDRIASPPARQEEREDEDAARHRIQMQRIALRSIWREAQPIAGTLAERYLRDVRGLPVPEDVEAAGALRFHPRCRRGEETHPALVALMRDPVTDKPCGIIRTFLHPDGRKLDRLALGTASAVKLSADEDVSHGLAIGEGVETCLRVMTRYACRPMWALGSASIIRSFPVLAGIGSLTVFADADDAGLSAAMECARRWRAAPRLRRSKGRRTS